METVKQDKLKRKYRKQATSKQLVALKLINEGLSARQAMIRAGYSKNVANNPKQNLFNSQAITNIVDKFHLQLKDEGITTGYLAKKYAEWLDAKREDFKQGTLPDYHTQLEAGKMLKDIFNISPIKQSENIAKRVTYEEYVQETV